jgi:histidine triad (HIT) family protein
MQPSIFTRIIKGEIPSHKIYEDDKTIAILDQHPLIPGHVLVIPKVQIDHIWDLSDEDYHYLWEVVKKLGTHIRAVIGSPRVGVSVEGFGVPHVHIHLIPIYRENDLQKHRDVSVEPDKKALAKMAKKLAFNRGNK